MKRAQIILSAILLIMFSVTVKAETLHISVASSMTDAFKAIIQSYSKKNPNIRILPNFASSGSLAKQIAHGAPADLYLSANPKWMDYLEENKLIAFDTRKTFACNKLVFVARPTTTISQFAQITSLSKIAIGSPMSVPAGQYAQQAMETAGLYASLQKGRKLVMAKDVRQALLYADRGEVDGSFVYLTDAQLVKSAKILFHVPEKLHDRVKHPLALTTKGKEREAVLSFYRFLETSQTRSILRSFGFMTDDGCQ